MLRKLALFIASGITVALGVLTVLVILGPGLIDPLLASDRIDIVRALVIALLVLAIACFVFVGVLDRKSAGTPG